MVKKSLLFAFLTLSLPAAVFAQPVCPVCTVAVGAGVGLCRYLGIDDLISGTWVGALLFSLTMWTLKWLNKKNIRFKFRPLAVGLAIYVLTTVPLYWIGIMGQVGNEFLGIDKLLLGIAVGTLAFILALLLERYLRNKNQGKAYFPFQKAAIPVLFLVILSLIFNSFC